MDPRLILAIFIGKFFTRLIKLFGGGATTAPGLFALYIDPQLVKKLSKKIKNGSVVISGTNGKTTTSRLITDILSTQYKVIHNRQGSNLLRGIATTLTNNSSILGKPNCNLAVWEVDEATVPEALENVSCKVLVLINLMRDQLDRYGEVDTTRSKWQKAIEKMPKNTALILNADDPGISILAKSYKGKVIYFGVNQEKIDLPRVENIADIRHCLNCGYLLNYSAVLSAHMGHYNCPKCKVDRPRPNVSASAINFKSDFSTSLKISTQYSALSAQYSLPGLYNVYNVLAAFSVGRILGIDRLKIAQTIESFGAAFGRFQKIGINDKNAIIFLIKNPAGANEVLRTIATRNNLNILAILNDNIADGRDVSWIWDTNWEIIGPRLRSASVSGTRAWDLATRLKYAGIQLSKNSIYMEVNYSIQKSLHNLSNKDTLLILSTYTALLQVQDSLNKLGGSMKWHEN